MILIFESSLNADKTGFEEVVAAAAAAASVVGGGSDDSQLSKGLKGDKGTTGIGCLLL